MIRIPLLQTVEKTAIRPQAWVNGFATSLLISVRADARKRAAGIKSPLASYTALHPYFLKRGANELRLEYALDLSALAPDDAGPWHLECRVAAMNYITAKELGTIFAEEELLRLASPPLPKREESTQRKTLTGSFAWTEGPKWAWTKAKPIENTPKNRKSLEAAVGKVWNDLNGLAGRPVPPDFAAGTRASIQEFIQASELRGKPFTFLAELLETSSRLALPGDKSPEEFLRDREARRQSRRGQPTRDDEPSAHPEVTPLPDGKLPPRLALRKLEAIGALEMSLLGDGRLARLTGDGGQSVIQFVSNYHDGARGEPGETRLKCDLWFRKNAKDHWELDAIYPTLMAGLALSNSWPQELFELQPY